MDYLYNDWREIVKSKPTTVAAGVSAIVGVAVGYPFDTLKTRMQVSDPPKPMNKVFNEIVKLEGYRALYRGILGPLCVVAFLRGMTFTTYDGSARQIFDLCYPVSSHQNITDNVASPQPSYSTISFSQKLPFLFLAGATAGSVTCLFSGPLELIKVQLQMGRQLRSQALADSIASISTPAKNVTPKEGIFGCMRRIFMSAGPFGFYRGFGAHLLRDFFGTGIYFGCYEAIKFNLSSESSFLKKRFDITVPLPICSLIAGGLAGTASWSCIFPIDVIKSRLQREAFFPPEKQRYNRSIIQCARSVFKGIEPINSEANVSSPGGFRAFYRGLPPTLLRALPIHALNFFVYEQMLAWVNSL